MSRVDNVAKNIKFALISQFLMVLVNFAARKVFVMTLGESYLGLNGLFTDILNMLSLAELGFGASIVFSLYKPVALNDTEKIKSLMRMYKQIYRLVGFFVLAVGVLLTPHLDFFISEIPQGINNIELIYILNVLNSAASYFFIYRASLLFADQKKYVQLVINTGVKCVAAIVQIVLLVITKNYFAYLGVMIASTLTQNILISVQTSRMYPYLKDKNVLPVPKEDKDVIKQNVGAMVFHKFGTVIVFSTDSIIMAKFINLATVGLYSNYILIRGALSSIIEPMFNAIMSSMGNLNALESTEKKYSAFKNIYFFSAWLFGFISICLINLYNPFITLWLGKDYTFPMGVVFMIVAYFYINCMRSPVTTTKEAMGFFKQDKFKPVVEALVNLVASVLLVKHMGIVGVVLGTIISSLAVPFWIEPLVVFKNGFNKNVITFFLHYILYLGVTFIAGGITWVVCSLTPDGIFGFILKMLVCAVMPNLVYLAVYFKRGEFIYLKDIALRMINKILKKA